MTDAIIRKLSSVRKVMVRATSAVEKFQGTDVDPLAAGRELKVDVVLDGNIQHAGNTIRVSIQMLRVSDGSPLWADHFDDYFTNIFELQDSISEKIVTALKMKLTESEHRRMAKRPTNNTEAYQFYLQGRDANRTALPKISTKPVSRFMKAPFTRSRICASVRGPRQQLHGSSWHTR